MARRHVSLSLRERVRLALEEDRAFDDVTTRLTVEPSQEARGILMAKARGVVAGMEAFKAVFGVVDKTVKIAAVAGDGDRVRPGQTVARVHGPLGSILRGERVALNLVCHLSGVATLTAACVAAARGTPARIMDTRKTTPLWRDLERQAVLAGGGTSHRRDLADMILVKDNHVDANGGIAPTLAKVFRRRPPRRVLVEVRSLDELRAALEFPVDAVLLDNMRRPQIAKAVEIIAGRAEAEVSGGIGPRDIRPLARLGVDRISMGRLTHSAPALDFSLKVAPTPRRP